MTARKLQQGLIVIVMAAGSMVLWVGAPIGWIWVGSRIQNDAGLLAAFAIIIGGIVISAIVIMRLLHGLSGLYGRVSGHDPVVRVRMPWHRSVRGETEGMAPMTLLDVVMGISVAIAMTGAAIWFLFFAGSSI